MPEVSAIVPAAGLSRRMGGPNKLLLPWGDSTIVGTVVQTLLKVVSTVIVVTGRDADQVAEATPGAQHIFNPHYEQGLGTSIAAGVSAAPEGHAFLIALGDMPSLQSAVITMLLEAYSSEQDIVIPTYQDQPDHPGHPVLFGAAYKKELETLVGDEGARSILLAHQTQHKLAQWPGRFDDIDRPEDNAPKAQSPKPNA